jgi:hypothetical protein
MCHNLIKNSLKHASISTRNVPHTCTKNMPQPCTDVSTRHVRKTCLKHVSTSINHVKHIPSNMCHINHDIPQAYPIQQTICQVSKMFLKSYTKIHKDTKDIPQACTITSPTCNPQIMHIYIPLNL